MVGLDYSEAIFRVHGADASGRAVLRKRLRRNQVADFSEVPGGPGGDARSTLLDTRDRIVRS